MRRLTPFYSSSAPAGDGVVAFNNAPSSTSSIGPTGTARRISTGVSSGCGWTGRDTRSEEHTSELQSHLNLVCRLLLEKKKKKKKSTNQSISYYHGHERVLTCSV